MILERLHEFIQCHNISFNRLEITLGVSHGSISNAFKNQKNIGSNVIGKILIAYPKLSAEWLLRGHGDMLINSDLAKENNDLEKRDQLLNQTLHFFSLKNVKELQSFYAKNLGQVAQNSLEDLILSTWERKYGQELKSLNHQVLTLFTAKLDEEKRSYRNSSNSKKA